MQRFRRKRVYIKEIHFTSADRGIQETLSRWWWWGVGTAGEGTSKVAEERHHYDNHRQTP